MGVFVVLYVCGEYYLGCVSPVNLPDIVSPGVAEVVRLACRLCRSRSCLTEVFLHSGDTIALLILYLV